jgi:hypothetical protein
MLRIHPGASEGSRDAGAFRSRGRDQFSSHQRTIAVECSQASRYAWLRGIRSPTPPRSCGRGHPALTPCFEDRLYRPSTARGRSNAFRITAPFWFCPRNHRSLSSENRIVRIEHAFDAIQRLERFRSGPRRRNGTEQDMVLIESRWRAPRRSSRHSLETAPCSWGLTRSGSTKCTRWRVPIRRRDSRVVSVITVRSRRRRAVHAAHGAHARCCILLTILS